ncbi:MAG: hypothetical protein ACJ790_15505 [Myxococcaceae bacterium]
MNLFRRAALVGAASGLRMMIGTAGLISARTPGLPAPLQKPVARLVAGAAIAFELVADKSKWIPSRLEPSSISGRIALASVAGAVLARGAKRPLLPAILVAAVACVAAAKIGHDVRAVLAERFNDRRVAAAEDALAIRLVTAAAEI